MPVRIELEDGPQGLRIWAQSPWSPQAGAQAKRISGANWSKTNKVWTYPASLQTCRDLREVYGDLLVIGPRLTAWAREQVAREKELHTLGRQHDAEIHIVQDYSADLAAAMDARRYQRSGAAFVKRARRVLIADEPSLGKTATTFAGLMEAGVWEGDHLVVAPKTSLSRTWGRQALQWGGEGVDVFPVPEGRTAREKTLELFEGSTARTRILVINPAMTMVKMADWCKKCGEWRSVIQPVKDGPVTDGFERHFAEAHTWGKEVARMDWPWLFGKVWNSVTLDESHEVLSAVTPSNVTQTTEGLLRLSVAPSGVLVSLTGTPLRGQERKLWGQATFLGTAQGGYWNWIGSYFEVTDNGFGKTIGGLRPDREEAFYAWIDTWVLRRLKSEVRSEIPQNPPPVDHWVEMTKKQRDVYETFQNEGEVVLGEGILSSVGVLSEMTRLKQLAWGEWILGEPTVVKDKEGRVIRLIPHLDVDDKCKSPKLDALIALLRERGVTGDPKTDWRNESGGYKYVIASQFTQVVDYIERKLNAIGIETLKVTGGVTGKRRDRAIQQFDESPDGPRVLVMNSKAGGTSIDLDTYCDEIFVVDETFIDDDQVQLVNRINNRKGEVRPRWIHYLRTLDTIEEGIATGNIAQAHIAAALLDIRRGVAVNVRELSMQNVHANTTKEI